MEKKDKKSGSVLNVFNKIAKYYTDYFGCDWEFLDEIKSFSSLFKPNSTILDLGCGSGYITDYLNKQNLNAIGIDFSSEMLNIAKEKYPQVKFLLDDFMNINDSFKENSVDGIISIYSLYFIPREKMDEFFKKISIILREGGKFLFVTQIGKGEEFIRTPLMIDNKVNDEIYVNYYMRNQLETMLNKYNFSIDYFKEKAVLDEKDITDGGRYIVLVTNNKHEIK